MKGGEKLSKDVTFNAVDVKRISMEEYGEDDYAIASVCFLSTRPNSHGIGISEDVLREYAPSVLGKWITAEVKCGDCTMHVPSQVITGVVPKNQDVRFVEADDGYLDAYVDCIISKRYAKDYCNVFSEDDPTRAVSIEATFDMIDDDNASAFCIKTITTLGKFVKPSVPNANITFVRFSEDEAETYYSRLQKGDALSNLKQFVEERKQSMADKKSYKVDKSKEAMSERNWGDVDKAAMRDKIMDAANRAKLVKDVYMLVEDGWEDAPSERLKYPVMMLDGDTFVYNRYALSSVLAYAKQNGEDAVVNKVEKIYKKLELDTDSERKEDAEMEKVKETEVVEAESKTEEMAEVECEEVKAAECEEPCDECEHEHDDEPDMEDMKAKLAKLEADIADRDHIIMDKDAELEELRKFKAEVEEQRKAAMVESVMAECKEYMSAEQFAETRDEGMACKPEELDAWSNRAKAVCFSAVKKSAKKAPADNGVWGFAAPINPNKSNGLWD